MAAPRLLVLADPKMLPALAKGLREAGRFEVVTIPLSDGGAAAAAAPQMDAVAVFYGGPGRPPLASTIQMLAPTVRSRGGRVVAVLPRDQAAQRDECFRAGASDLLFMPLPKEQFVSRVERAVALAFSADPGATAQVQVSSRTSQSKLASAVVTPEGVHASSGVPFQPGETVRLSWDTDGAQLHAWGLVAMNEPEARIRFAGLGPDEEATVRDWVRKRSQGARPEERAAPAPVAASLEQRAAPGAARPEQPSVPAANAATRVRSESAAAAAPVAGKALDVRQEPAAAAQPADGAIPLPAPRPPPPPAEKAPAPLPGSAPPLGSMNKAIPLPAPTPVASRESLAPPSRPPSGSMPGGPPGVPLAGPPPGFADRPRTRDGSAPRPPAGPAAPSVGVVATTGSPGAASSPAGEPEPGSAFPIPDLPRVPPPPGDAGGEGLAASTLQPNGETPRGALRAGVDLSLFEGIQTPAPMPPVPSGPPRWPIAGSSEVTKAALLAALFDPYGRPTAAPEVVTSAVRVAGSLSGDEKSAIDRLGAESHFADAAAERVVIDLARAEGGRLAAGSQPCEVDDAALRSMTQRADAIVARLQKDADGAIAHGDLENLQVIRTTSAALSRDLLSLKATADRLRGLAAAPRLGAGALDPNVMLPGQQLPSTRPPPKVEVPARPELREFEQFAEKSPAQRKKTALIVALVALAASIVYVTVFALPHTSEIDGRSTNIPGIVHIQLGDTVARVVVSDAFVDKPEPSLSQLISLLRERKMASAMLTTVNGSAAGQIDVKTGRTAGISGLKKPAKPPAPSPGR